MGWRDSISARKQSNTKPKALNTGVCTAITVHVDVAACIRWAGFAIALIITALSAKGEQVATFLPRVFATGPTLPSSTLPDRRAAAKISRGDANLLSSERQEGTQK